MWSVAKVMATVERSSGVQAVWNAARKAAPLAFPSFNRFQSSSRGKANAMLAPALGRARGGPVSFLPLAMRGVTRREDALSGLRRTARTITPGGPGSPGPGASADAPRQLGAPRGISGFTPSTVRSDRPAVLVPREGYPPPPGDVTCVASRSRVPHPAPPSRHLMRMPLGGRDGHNLGLISP